MNPNIESFQDLYSFIDLVNDQTKIEDLAQLIEIIKKCQSMGTPFELKLGDTNQEDDRSRFLTKWDLEMSKVLENFLC